MNKNLIKNKVAYLASLILPVILVFFRFIYTFENLVLWKTVLYSLGLTFLLLYLVYLAISTFNLAIMIVLGKEIKFYSIYPFTYDGNYQFNPLKLLVHQELYSPRIVYNLDASQAIKERRNIEIQFQTNIYIALLSKVLGVMMVATVILLAFGFNLFVEFIVLLTLSVLRENLKYNENHFGYIYVAKQSNPNIYILANQEAKFVDFVVYDEIFKDYGVDEELSKKLYLDLVLNYLYKSIDKERTPISIELMKPILKFDEKMEYLLETLNTLKFLGIAGLVTQNYSYINHSKQAFYNIIEYLDGMDSEIFKDLSIKNLEEYVKFLDAPKNNSLDCKHLIMDLRNIYSYSDDVELKIRALICRFK